MAASNVKASPKALTKRVSQGEKNAVSVIGEMSQQLALSGSRSIEQVSQLQDLLHRLIEGEIQPSEALEQARRIADVDITEC